MRLRNLELKDAPLMLEWMHDESVVGKLKGNFIEKTLADAESFILASANKEENIHLAIVSNEDEYMGTVSLKNVENGSAEFAITVRKSAMGRGYSWYGMEEIIRLAFEKYGLESVYWCVSRENERAVRFYDKHNFHEALDIPSLVLERYKEMNNLKFGMLSDEIGKSKAEITDKTDKKETTLTIDAGENKFVEMRAKNIFECFTYSFEMNYFICYSKAKHCFKSLEQ